LRPSVAAQRQWEEAGTVAALLIDNDWDVHQESWVHHHALEEIAAVLVAAGALDAALRLQQQFCPLYVFMTCVHWQELAGTGGTWRKWNRRSYPQTQRRNGCE
jgi:hypothetical protein